MPYTTYFRLCLKTIPPIVGRSFRPSITSSLHPSNPTSSIFRWKKKRDMFYLES